MYNKHTHGKEEKNADIRRATIVWPGAAALGIGGVKRAITSSNGSDSSEELSCKAR